jgi:hypothetical protein
MNGMEQGWDEKNGFQKSYQVACHPDTQYFSFPATNLSLSWKEAGAISRAYNHHWHKRPAALSTEENNTLSQLESKLHNIIQQRGKVFVKLGGQSPKDIALFANNEKTQSILRKKLSKAPETDENAQLIAFLEAVNLSLCVESGTQALQSIILRYPILFNSIQFKKSPQRC